MGATGSGKTKRGCGSWLLGSILLLVVIVFVGVLLTPKDSQFAARLDAAFIIGLRDVPTGTTDRLEVDRALGFVVTAAWNGENVEDDQYEVDEGVITIFDEAGRVLCNAPLDAVRRPEWQALSTWERVGFWPEQDGNSMVVDDLRVGSPAEAAGLLRGDVIERCDGWPAAAQGLYAALLNHLAGGELALHVSRDGEPMELSVPLAPLLPAELLQDSSDPLGTWRDHALSMAEF
jgi:hypothetical protein